MPIPHADRATVPREKIVDYLLNVDHPVGGSKADWFISLGYDSDSPEVLVDDLINVARICREFSEQQVPHGVKYIASGRIISPTGIEAEVLTVWILDPDATSPRLVSAYPAKKGSDERA